MMAVSHWHWSQFSALSPRQVHDLLRLRQEVFVVEQDCPYRDADGKDPNAWHLLGYSSDGQLLTYLRLFAPGDYFAEVALGRIVSAPKWRGCGLGKSVVKRGIEMAHERYPNHDIRISAQKRLLRFYTELGFVKASDEYLEDGILHIEMLLSVVRPGQDVNTEMAN